MLTTGSVVAIALLSLVCIVMHPSAWYNQMSCPTSQYTHLVFSVSVIEKGLAVAAPSSGWYVMTHTRGPPVLYNQDAHFFVQTGHCVYEIDDASQR